MKSVRRAQGWFLFGLNLSNAVTLDRGRDTEHQRVVNALAAKRRLAVTVAHSVLDRVHEASLCNLPRNPC